MEDYCHRLWSKTAPSRRSQIFLVITVAVGVFTDLFVYGVLIPITPFIFDRRHLVRSERLQFWAAILLAVYNVGLLGAAPLSGWIADRTSTRKLPFLAGLAALVLSTGLLWIGKDVGFWIAGRLLQGVSSAIVWSIGLAMLADAVAPNRIGIVMGYISMAVNLSIVLGPLLGGLMFANSGYHAVFATSFGLIGLDSILRLLLREPQSWTKTVQATSNNTSDVEKSGAVQVNDEHPRKSSRIPFFALLSSRRLLCTLLACVANAALLTSLDALLPVFANESLGWDSAGAGLIFLPLAIPCLFSPIIGGLADRHGCRWYSIAGFMIAALGFTSLSLLSSPGIFTVVSACLSLGTVGVALAMVLTPMMAEIQKVVLSVNELEITSDGYRANRGLAQGYSLFTMAWGIGGLLGPLASGLAKENFGWAVVTRGLGVLSLLAAVPTFWTGA